MKNILLLFFCITVAISLSAQGNKNKGKDKSKEKSEQTSNDSWQQHEKKIWIGTKDNDGGGPKPSKNQPAKVRSAFQRDYPNASNVQWSKYRGDWTATFRRGPFWSTAVYHANGDRRDTRTSVLRPQLPQIILEKIFKKKIDAEPGDVIIKIEAPKSIKDIFRIKTNVDGNSRFLFYNSDGVEVTYEY